MTSLLRAILLWYKFKWAYPKVYLAKPRFVLGASTAEERQYIKTKSLPSAYYLPFPPSVKDLRFFKEIDLQVLESFPSRPDSSEIMDAMISGKQQFHCIYPISGYETFPGNSTY